MDNGLQGYGCESWEMWTRAYKVLAEALLDCGFGVTSLWCRPLRIVNKGLIDYDHVPSYSNVIGIIKIELKYCIPH